MNAVTFPERRERSRIPLVNGLSVDVEDWFQVGAFEDVIERDQWSGLTDREAVGKGLKLLEDYDWLASERRDTGGRPSVVWWANPVLLK